MSKLWMGNQRVTQQGTDRNREYKWIFFGWLLLPPLNGYVQKHILIRQAQSINFYLGVLRISTFSVFKLQLKKHKLCTFSHGLMENVSFCHRKLTALAQSHLLGASRKSWFEFEAWTKPPGRRCWSRCCRSPSEDEPRPSWWPNCEPRIRLEDKRRK